MESAMYTARGLVAQNEIADKVAAVADQFRPEVVRVRYSLGANVAGEPSIFFRILLTDKAAKKRNLLQFVKQVEAALDEAIDFYEYGLSLYFSYRSESEQADLKEEIWN